MNESQSKGMSHHKDDSQRMQVALKSKQFWKVPKESLYQLYSNQTLANISYLLNLYSELRNYYELKGIYPNYFKFSRAGSSMNLE